MRVLSVRTAVNAQQQRNLRPFHITDGICQQAMDFGSVFTLESDFFGLREVEFIHQRVVLMSDLSQRLSFERENFSRLSVAAGKYDGAAASRRQTGNGNRRIEQLRDRVAVEADQIDR